MKYNLLTPCNWQAQVIIIVLKKLMNTSYIILQYVSVQQSVLASKVPGFKF